MDGPPNLEGLADAADELGRDFIMYLAEKRDEIYKKFGDDSNAANHVALNAMINALAYGVAIIRAQGKDEDLDKHLDPVMVRLHETVTELLGEDGKSVFLQIRRS